MEKQYRGLTLSEQSALTANGCHAEDWSGVMVGDGFVPDNIRNVRFGGRIRIGACRGRITDIDGMSRKTGIYDAELINCTVGDDVFISRTGSYIANYDIGDEALVENTGRIVCRGESRFGNGVRVKTVNEAGGREVSIFDGLSAQTAYIAAFYRYRPELIAKIDGFVEEYCRSVASSRGKIGRGARIHGCNIVRDVNVGPYTIIDGASELHNGTVNSSREYATYIGPGVTAHNFICAQGAHLFEGVFLERCFVGEACRLENGFTATDSLFFANCHMNCGEANSIFAGPYTVSHHKSSLLIAGYFLFFNAGSGSNQSNHLFKSGPVHQGIHERGCKFGSDAYVVLPAREGAYTTVIGRHSSHHDTEAMPYSYMFDEEGKTYLHPGANLRSFGTLRDIAKWPLRDGRSPEAVDRIHFEEYNPYLGAKFVEAIEVCNGLLGREGVETHNYGRVRIKTSVLKRGRQLYVSALKAFIGNILAKGCPVQVDACAEWVDAAGMFIPRAAMEKLVGDVESGAITDIAGLEGRFDLLYADYDSHAYAWALSALDRLLERRPAKEDVEEMVRKGKDADAELQRMRREDGLKDSSSLMEVGYGMDAATPDEREADFRTVRNL